MKSVIKTIIYIANARIPTEKAHGFQICKMCEEFSNAGIEVELWAPARKNNIKEDVFAYYGLKNNFKIRRIECFDFLRFEKYLGKFSFYFQSFLYLLKLTVRKADKNSCVFSRNPEIIWLFELKGAKTCYECHDWFAKNKLISLRLLKNTDYIVTTNNYIKQEFVRNNFSDKQILTAPHGVNHAIFDLRVDRVQALKKLNIDHELEEKIEENQTLVYTGSFKTIGTGKGIEEILAALKILSAEKIIFLAIGGSSQDIGYYQKIAGDLMVSEKASFLPRQSQADLALYQKIAHILLMPFPDIAHYRHYMTPIKMFEYMAGQRPIIASCLPSIKEILNEKNCVFCLPGDAEDLAKKIKFVLKNKKLAEKIASQAYSDVKDRTWGERARSIINFIKQ